MRNSERVDEVDEKEALHHASNDMREGERRYFRQELYLDRSCYSRRTRIDGGERGGGGGGGGGTHEVTMEG